MTNKQIELVQQSWLVVKPIADIAALNFYEKLFQKAPGIRHLFKGDVKQQAQKLAAMLTFVVRELHRVDDIVDDVKNLGLRHQNYGAKPEHYDLVGVCLIETLAEGLGEKWNQEVEMAWIAAYTILKDAMIGAQVVEVNVEAI